LERDPEMKKQATFWLDEKTLARLDHQRQRAPGLSRGQYLEMLIAQKEQLTAANYVLSARLSLLAAPNE
ncbi:MAG: hypothetical protein ACYCOR_21245, partial [Acidobacteriaceae bacterium]